MKQTKETLKKQMDAKVKSIPLETLKEMAEMLMNNFEDGSILVWCSVLDELEARMDERDFVDFCDNL